MILARTTQPQFILFTSCMISPGLGKKSDDTVELESVF